MVPMRAEFVDSVARHGRNLQTFEECLRIAPNIITETKRLTKNYIFHFAELQEGGSRQNSCLHYHNGNCATNSPGLRAGEEDTAQLDGEVRRT